MTAPTPRRPGDLAPARLPRRSNPGRPIGAGPVRTAGTREVEPVRAAGPGEDPVPAAGPGAVDPVRVVRPAGTAPASPLVAAVARGVALVVVVPVRLLWELCVAGGRLVYRWLLTPVGRFLARWLLRPLGWLLYRAVWLPFRWIVRALAWAVRVLVWKPAVLVARALDRLGRVVLWRPLAWLAYRLVWLPAAWLGRLLAPVGRRIAAGLAVAGRWLWRVAVATGGVLLDALGYAWRVAGRLLWWGYALTLRPFVLASGWLWRRAVVPLLRVVRVAWRSTVTPLAGWCRRAVVDPARTATREVLVALGLRR